MLNFGAGKISLAYVGNNTISMKLILISILLSGLCFTGCSQSGKVKLENSDTLNHWLFNQTDQFTAVITDSIFIDSILVSNRDFLVDTINSPSALIRDKRQTYPFLNRCDCVIKEDQVTVSFYNSVLDRSFLMLEIVITNGETRGRFFMEDSVNQVQVKSIIFKKALDSSRELFGLLDAHYFDEGERIERKFEGPFKCPIRKVTEH
jgi:hypothetical protein